LSKIEINAADYESMGFACDPNYYNPSNPYDAKKGPFSTYRRCLYGRDTFEYVIEFGREFLATYKKEKKVLMLDFIDLREGTGEVIKYLDSPLAAFLREV
jgi:hypothetical protein